MAIKYLSALVAACILLSWAQPARATDYVVVGVENAPAFALGDVIDGARFLLLEKGGTLMLIDTAGRKISLKGPHAGSLDDSAGGSEPVQPSGSLDIVKALARVFAGQDKDTSTLGVFRSMGAVSMQSDPWLVNAANPGHFCFAKAMPLSLWRAETALSATVHIRAKASNHEAVAAWPIGTNKTPWPMELNVADGQVYLVRMEGQGEAKPLTLHRVPADLPTRVHRAAWMADNGCADQSVLLVITSDVELLIDALAKGGKF